jgi:hypothetical protein
MCDSPNRALQPELVKVALPWERCRTGDIVSLLLQREDKPENHETKRRKVAGLAPLLYWLTVNSQLDYPSLFVHYNRHDSVGSCLFTQKF